jgi:hypothetical protein
MSIACRVFVGDVVSPTHLFLSSYSRKWRTSAKPFTRETSRPNTRRRKLRKTTAFCLVEGLVWTSRTIMMIRDASSKERLIKKERRPLMVPRKICSGTGLISTVGSDGSFGSIMDDNAAQRS